MNSWRIRKTAIPTVAFTPQSWSLFVYVLHCFEKKAKSGIATPKRELDAIRRRLKEAMAEYREYQRSQNAKNR